MYGHYWWAETCHRCLPEAELQAFVVDNFVLWILPFHIVFLSCKFWLYRCFTTGKRCVIHTRYQVRQYLYLVQYRSFGTDVSETNRHVWFLWIFWYTCLSRRQRKVRCPSWYSTKQVYLVRSTGRVGFSFRGPLSFQINVDGT